MPSQDNKEQFFAQPTLEETPQFFELVELWLVFFEDADRAGKSLKVEEVIVGGLERVTIRATEIFAEHFPNADPEAKAVGDLNGPKVWALKAMLAAYDIRNQAAAAKPEDAVL